MTVFLFLRRLWPVPMFSLPPRPLIVVRFTSPLSGIRGQQARTRFSRSRTAFGLPRSLRWLSSAYFREAPGIHRDGTHSCDSPLGSAPLVFGPGPTLFSGVCATSPYLGLVYGAAYLVSPAFEPLSQAYFRTLPLTTLFLLALATAKMGWGATGSLFHGHLCGWG